MTRLPATGTRILVGASSFVDARAALHLLGRLMEKWQPSIGGVLVEDTASLAVCTLPNQRVITPGGTVAMAPTASQIRTLIEADARAFKQSLAQLAGDAGAPWTFERDIGDLVQTGLNMARAWDILIFAHRNLHPIAGKVVLLESSASADSPVRDMAKLLSAHLTAENVVLTVSETAYRTTEDQTSSRQTSATLDEALGRLARLNAQAVLVDLSRGPVHTAEELHRLIEVARCPIFVFGTVSATSLLEHTIQMPPVPTAGKRSGV